MRIWVGNRFHPRDLLGGAELQSLQIAKGLLARGHQVTFLALEGEAHKRHGQEREDEDVRVEQHSAAPAVVELTIRGGALWFFAVPSARLEAARSTT